MSAAIDPSDFRIAPSILPIGFARLGGEVRRVLESGADWIRFDAIDSRYVSNLAVGSLVCEAIRLHVQRDGKPVPIDVHLMVSPADRIIPDLTRTDANLIIFHPEVSEHVDHSPVLTRDNGYKAGLAFSPVTPLHHLDHVMDRLDMVLIMSVNPDFGGQSFISEVPNKLRATYQRLDTCQDKTGRKVLLEIDGGVEADNIAEIAKVGADTFVVGSAVFGRPNVDGGYQGTVGALR